MQERIQQLERLVVDLMQQTSAQPEHSAHDAILTSRPPSPRPVDRPGASATPTPHEDVTDADSIASDCGSMQVTDAGSSYVNSAHWAAVLDGIAEIKDHFEKEEDATRRVPEPHGAGWTCPQLLYGCPRLTTKEEILASIPARPVVDRLVSRYFNSFEMSPGQFLHRTAVSSR